MKILISGSSGLVGRALTAALETRGHNVIRLVRDRKQAASNSVFWDPHNNQLDPADLSGIEGVVHLAGESVSSQRWTDAEKKEILASRTLGTTLLGKACASLTPPPKVFVSASAIGYYGSHGSKELTEQSPSGSDFLAQVCVEWELAAQESVSPATRLVIARIGIVLGRSGGAIKKMLLPFQLGAGGTLGDGTSYMSWISLPDAVEAIIFCLENESVRGPVNLVAPAPVTNREFTEKLAKRLHRPAFFTIPKFVLRLIYGEMADQTILSSMRVLPTRLLEKGFAFKHTELEHALIAVL